MTSGLMSEVTSSVMSGDKSGMASVVLPGLGWAESRRLAGAAACPPRPLGNWTRLGDGTFCSGSNPSLCLFLSRFGCLFLSLCLLFRLFVCLDVNNSFGGISFLIQRQTSLGSVLYSGRFKKRRYLRVVF